jgi:hypothetical protein
VKPWFAVVPAALVLVLASPASAAPGDLGYDVSHPQCTGSTFSSQPQGTPAFAVVGVNNGLGRTTNPCLQEEATWAALSGDPMLYANGATPGPSSPNWPSSGRTSPAACLDGDSTTDSGCAYDYGWDLATDALTRAGTQTSIDETAVVWWIDVEIANTWALDGDMNAASIQGMVDRLRAGGVPDVGVYGLATDWSTITGSSALGTTSYRRATAATYRAHWGFVPTYPIEDGPLWFAGAGTEQDVPNRCALTSFTGGERLLAQYANGGFDGDYRCADRDLIAPTASMKAPGTLVTTAPKLTIGWTGSDFGSGLASYDVLTTKAAATGSFGPWAALYRRYLSTSASVTAPARGSTTCWEARSRDAAGNVSPYAAKRCAATPLDDRDLAASTGWTRTTGASGWFTSSYSSTTRQGATLTRSGLQTAHLVLLAYRCPTCGSLVVQLNGTTYRSVSLASATSGRVQIEIPRFSRRTTSVTLKVTSSGKLVRVDGLATSQV